MKIAWPISISCFAFIEFCMSKSLTFVLGHQALDNHSEGKQAVRLFDKSNIKHNDVKYSKIIIGKYSKKACNSMLITGGEGVQNNRIGSVDGI